MLLQAMTDDRSYPGRLSKGVSAMKISFVTIAAIGLVVGLIGSTAQASVNVTGPKKAEVSRPANGARVAWCYWYRDANNRVCR